MPEPKSSPVIRLRGVRHNNLKNFDLDLPLHRLIVVTGLSGSGKSSLAFDTLYAEGQRRYIETFSPYARQFFDRMDKPQVDSIEGIPPAIAIEQRNAVRTTRSTVGTMTEVCDYMKVLWPHVAQLHCRGCGKPVRKDSPQEIWQTLQSSSSSFSSSSSKLEKRKIEDEDEGRGRAGEVLITFDLPLSEKLSLAESFALVSKQGYQRLLLNGEIVRLDEAGPRIQHPASSIQHLTVVQDRVKLAPANRARFVEACEQAYHFGKGRLAVRVLNPDANIQHPASSIQHRFSNKLHCAACDIEYTEPSPALFSFNHPLGACPTCKGFGRVISIDYDLAIPDRSLTLAQGAVRPWRSGVGADSQRDLIKFCKARAIPMNSPFGQLSGEHQRLVIEGEPDYGIDEDHEWPRAWYGIKGYFKWLETKAYKMHVRVLLSRYRAYTKCPECDGARLKPDALLYLLTVGDDVRRLKFHSESPIPSKEKLEPPHAGSYEKLTLADFYALPIRDALELTARLATEKEFSKTDPISHALNEVRARLAYLNEVGLGYLSLERPTRTLSGGETERVNLTTCLGTRLVNTLFVLDEPSVGLHPRDTDRLVRILEKLRDTGNTVVVVEHEASVMRAADQIVDLGPGHGATGGELVFQGSFNEILNARASLTGAYLSGRERIEIPARRKVGQASRLPSPAAMDRRDACPTLRITNATRHNLKNLSVEIPLNRFVCVTGVSGSGKSTLIRDVLLPALEARLKSQISDLKSVAIKASDRLNDPPSLRLGAASEDEDHSSSIQHQASSIEGAEHLGRVVMVDQSLLGKTPRSNPAVYIGAFDDIREVFAQSEAATQRGLNASAFSFNSVVGQCERCRGAGFEKIEMQFLSDIFIRCPDCNGRRYRAHIMEVKVAGTLECGDSSPLYAGDLSPSDTGDTRKPRAAERGAALPTSRQCGESGDKSPHSKTNRVEWSIADLLEATVDEVVEFLSGFADSRPAQRAVASLKMLQEVGLGYLRLGQPINTLSGGESQRLKLVRHLAEFAVPASAGSLHEEPPEGGTPNRTLFLFDEPTTGLHFDDVRVLLKVFQRLVNAGHSVIVIEHNLEVIKCADWVIDLGPEAGDGGGQVVACGTPEEVAKCKASQTGRFLRKVLPTARNVERQSRK